MSPLPTRKIGDTEVSAIGFGAMGLSAFYGTAESDEERFKVRVSPTSRTFYVNSQIMQVLDAALSSGSTFWDTADVYGDSEDLLGKWSVSALYAVYFLRH